MTDFTNRLKGMLTGLALGDALGVPHEFRYQTDVYTGELKYKAYFRYFRAGIDFNLEIGQISDDTELSILLARHLIKNNGKYNQNEMILEYMEWANCKSTFATGRNTRFLFKGVKTVRGYEGRKRKQDNNCQSNGALMRCAILSLIDMDSALKDCKITNPHSATVETNRLYLNILKMIFKNKTKDEIKTYLKNYDYDDLELHFSIKDGILGQRLIGRNKGWCMHGIYCAIVGLLHYNSYTEAINAIINFGGDTDTNACIAGAVLGAYYGYDLVYNEQKSNIDIMLNCTTEKGDKPRPKKYRVTDLENVVRDLYDIFK